jgi:hypothetical protein
VASLVIAGMTIANYDVTHNGQRFIASPC